MLHLTLQHVATVSGGPESVGVSSSCTEQHTDNRRTEMLNFLSQIADRYTADPDPTPELTFARFIVGLVNRGDQLGH
jgi:serine/threonine protein kinase HipA of HipAB toxin-antitoxin module